MATNLSLLFLILVSFSFPCSSFDHHPKPNDDDQFSKLFQEWKEKHGKVYEYGSEEEEKRFRNFKNNLNYIMERNLRKGDTSREEHKVGMNKFADLSNLEFREIYLSKMNKPLKKKMMISHGEICDAPSSMDWRKHGVVTAVKDQGRCGSCWAFSSTGAIEGIHAIVTGNLTSLSAQELVDCNNKTNYGCNGGYMNTAYEWIIRNGGIDSESDYPYTGLDDTCNTKKRNEKVATIEGYKDVDQNEKSLLCAVANQPVSVAIDGSATDFQLYTDGIYDGDCLGNPSFIDHAVLIVGYGSRGDEDQYWIVKNSWGSDWGMDGYVYIRRNTTKTYGVCAINAAASYPTLETSSSPPPYPSPVSPPPPPPPPPPPSPSSCGKFAHCSANETCCCIFELFNYCLFYGCCEYENGVCCTGFGTGVNFCCPSDYPVCNLQDRICLKNDGDYLGMEGKKCRVAKYKLPWTKKYAETSDEDIDTMSTQWKWTPIVV